MMASASQTRRLAMSDSFFVLIALGILWALSNVRTHSGAAILLFGRWDVIAITLLFCLPLSWLVVERIQVLSLRYKGLGVLFFIAVSGSILLFARMLELSSVPNNLTLVLLRVAVSTLLLSAATCICNLGFGFKPVLPLPSSGWLTVILMLGTAIFVPLAYTDAVSVRLKDNLQQALAEQRLAMACYQTQQLEQLNPHLSVNGIAMRVLHQQLNEVCRNLSADAATELGRSPSAASLGRRVTTLMQLDRLEEALPLLQALSQGEQANPVSLDYLGLCYQRLELPEPSKAAYQRSVEFWAAQPDSPSKLNSLASAYRGIGFAARRLEERSLEELAYRELVEVSPTAENHLLLAQCYREHQKTKLAAIHATRAQELSPELSQSAQGILTVLTMDHFGCMQVPR